ncbi:CLOCK-interacting pacemaker [Zootoca vivipara]|uniref:CLOCK-interacting pacemaker n=1 Tax=Zootoca vivipara TaxID=8524 RepID=UPI00293BC125|nr:CLOCK-interacting pacemaker [Zootoca vivipara]XP_034973588.2 CLOCK-interacting pacemaker [Zootoca vivipara]XP_034973589.2 CLOCK-interacting pacemaker [Zootoca vivipara]XP_034973594.2 CLOCK-interacting pacemaker [Zootoca vivipara]
MPSDKTSPLVHPSKLGKEKTILSGSLKAESSNSEGHMGQSKPTMMRGSGRRPRPPASEGEKDSGFSDESSEHLSAVEQTDAEDQPAYPLRQGGALQRAAQKAHGGLAGGAFPGLTPVYIVKNVILKQPHAASPTTQLLAWNSQHPLSSTQGSPTHVLLIQPPSGPLKPLFPGQKSPAKEAAYLPILSTYPKIAPHPGCDPQVKGLEGGGGGGSTPAGGASKNKRFCLEEAWVSSSEAATPKGSREKQRKEAPPASSGQLASTLLCPEALSQNTVSSSTGLDLAEGRMISRASKKLGCSSSGKQRRFHNTVQVLRKSGLLGITLRTKELIRQNNSTQWELAQLREHAQLLCEAVQSNDFRAWARLQEAMDRSASYWAKKGASSSYTHVWQQRPKAETTGPTTETPGEPLPGSPMSLSLTPDTSVHVALP